MKTLNLIRSIIVITMTVLMLGALVLIATTIILEGLSTIKPAYELNRGP